MNREYNRVIESGFAADDKKANEILRSVIGQIADGIWENCNGMDKYWLNFDIGDDNKILVNAETGTYYCHKWLVNPYYGKTDAEVRKYIANKVKQIVKINLEDRSISHEWKRDNNTECGYLGYEETITVADAYRVYDRLLGRKIYA